MIEEQQWVTRTLKTKCMGFHIIKVKYIYQFSHSCCKSIWSYETINYKQGWGRLLSKVIDQITITLNFLDFLQKCLRWQGFNFTKHPCHFIFFSDDIFLNLKDLLHHQIIFVSNDLLMIHRVGIQHIQLESTHTYTMYTTTYCNNSLYIIKP